MRVVTIRAVRNPGSTLERRMRLRINSPAPISRTTDSATSAMTSVPRRRPWPEVVRLAAFSDRLRSTLPIKTIGSKAKIIPMERASASAKPSMRRSTPTSASRGTTAGASPRIKSIPAAATIQPRIAPPSARTRLSVTSWRAMRPRVAPSEARTAISCWRLAASEITRLATLTATIRRMKPTAASSRSNAGRTSRTISPARGARRTPQPRSNFACACSSLRASRLISLRAPSRSRPARSLPITIRLRVERISGAGLGCTGVKASVPPRKSKNGGRTPTIVQGWPLIVAGPPTTEESPPNCRCQSPWLRITTLGPRQISSAGRNSRPTSGRTPRVRKNPAVTVRLRIWSGSPGPLKFRSGVELLAAARLSKTVFSAR